MSLCVARSTQLRLISAASSCERSSLAARRPPAAHLIPVQNTQYNARKQTPKCSRMCGLINHTEQVQQHPTNCAPHFLIAKRASLNFWALIGIGFAGDWYFSAPTLRLSARAVIERALSSLIEKCLRVKRKLICTWYESEYADDFVFCH